MLSPTCWMRYAGACWRKGWGPVGPLEHGGVGGLGKGGRAGAGSRLMQTCPLQKERDLELAARIGQSLLKQNRSLTERNELLEEQLELAKEEVTAPGCRVLALPLRAQLRGGCGPLGHALMSLSLSDRAAAPRGLHAGRPAPLLHHLDRGERACLHHLHAVSGGSLSHRSPRAGLLLGVRQRRGAGAVTVPGVAAGLALPSLLWVQPRRAGWLQTPCGLWGEWGGGWVGSPILSSLQALSALPAISRLRRQDSSPSLQQYFQYDTLQQKLKSLEEENQKLRTEVSRASCWDAPLCTHLCPASCWGGLRSGWREPGAPAHHAQPLRPLPQATNIATKTCQYEEQEQQLMIDCVEQFCTWGWACGVGGSSFLGMGWDGGSDPGGDGPCTFRSRGKPAGHVPLGGAGPQGRGHGAAAGGDQPAPGPGRGAAAEVPLGELSPACTWATGGGTGGSSLTCPLLPAVRLGGGGAPAAPGCGEGGAAAAPGGGEPGHSLAGGACPAAPRAMPELCPHPQLRDLQEKYAECGGMLQEAREEVKSLRSRSLPNSTISRYGAPSLLPVVSWGQRVWGAPLSPPSADAGSPVSPGLAGS